MAGQGTAELSARNLIDAPFLAKVEGVREAQRCILHVTHRFLQPCPCIPLHPTYMSPVSHCVISPPLALPHSSTLPVLGDKMVAMLGVTPPLPELLLLPGTPRHDGCSQHLHIQWLQVGAGKGPWALLQGALPGVSRSVEARSCLLHVKCGPGEGTWCPGVCQSRAEAQCHPRPAVGKIHRPLSPWLWCQRWAECFTLISSRVPPATPHQAGTPLPKWL